MMTLPARREQMIAGDKAIADRGAHRRGRGDDAGQPPPGKTVETQPAASIKHATEDCRADPAGNGDCRCDAGVSIAWKQKQAADDGRGKATQGREHRRMRVLVRE